MIKYIFVFAFLLAVVYSFAVENEDDSLTVDAENNLVPEEEERGHHSSGLPLGAECDGDGSDCQCAGKCVKCGCPYFWKWRGKKCHCKKGWFFTCSRKKSCPNKDEWED